MDFFYSLLLYAGTGLDWTYKIDFFLRMVGRPVTAARGSLSLLSFADYSLGLLIGLLFVLYCSLG